MISAIRQHYATHRRRSPAGFFWWITLEGLALSALCAALFHFIAPAETRPLPVLSGIQLFLKIVLIAPVVETLVLQAVPVALARRLGAGFRGQVLAAWLPFAAIHFFNGVASGVSAGVIGGFYLAFPYVHWRQADLRAALVLTMGSHAFANLVAYTGGVISGEF